MEDVSNKLVFLLRHKLYNHTIFAKEETIKNFVLNIKEGNISYNLLNYLYNYLYTKNNNIINLVFVKNRIILREHSRKSNTVTYKYNVFEDEKRYGNVKRTNIIIEYNKKDKSTKAKKQIHYGLDNGLDLIILETGKYHFSEMNTLDEIISSMFVNDNYKKASFIILKDLKSRVYETTEKRDGKTVTYKSYLSNDVLSKNNEKKYEVVNEVKSNKKIFSYLADLYSKESYNNNYLYENYKDNNLDAFFDNFKTNSNIK